MKWRKNICRDRYIHTINAHMYILKVRQEMVNLSKL